ncbi:phosphomannomutase/phosphoglucomutase [Microcoleus sp. PH2017_28_MFU_U_A]|uniref:phosphomannomutase/phosphoglucomutase n=1 Tax=Microcoleus sp. PH2017_28_MFU_U_A TaxID=2798838 RepID=UPI001D3C4267|nr:phosphomannomutase/phosphoglucomutase [Microcoleus sp. PH2017_28_MFU_U_A]MCC3590435.1 phosphomannomutase/phosphoglucomutase [Microcoleus sp. PH2017_28_MFU_U_A]
MQNYNWKKLQNGSDIRGIALEGVPDEKVNLTPEIATILGQSFVSWLVRKVHKPAEKLIIAIGRDSRLSGPTLMQAVMDGIASVGCTVYDFEMASTPAMFMSTITPGFECDGAIMLTASHLPFNRNGLKFFTAKGGLQKKDITDILTFAETNEFKKAAVFGTITKHDFISVYGNQFVEKIRESVNHPDNFEQPLTGLKIVVDAGNGAGGFYVDKVLKPLGADTTGSQFLEPDGTFPNHVPNPEDKQAMQSICQAVIANQADFGIIFDTDVDRSAAVDQFGKELNRNRLIALISAIVLQEHPGSTVVTDSITSDGLTQFIEQDLKGIHHRFKRGYKNVIDESIRLNAAGQESWLAIETSGHGALKENYFLDDGAYLVSKLLIELAKSKLANQSLPDLIANLQEPEESAEFRIKIGVDDFKAQGNLVIEKLQEFVSTQADWGIVPNNYEGLRVSCTSASESGWFLLRLSLHDPVMPLNVESNVKGGVAQIVDRLLAFFQTTESLDLSALSSR